MANAPAPSYEVLAPPPDPSLLWTECAERWRLWYAHMNHAARAAAIAPNPTPTPMPTLVPVLSPLPTDPWPEESVGLEVVEVEVGVEVVGGAGVGAVVGAVVVGLGVDVVWVAAAAAAKKASSDTARVTPVPAQLEDSVL